MKSRERHSDGDLVARAAAEWVLRHDRGLTASEQDEFSQWLAADVRHRTAWGTHRSGWDELDRLAGLQVSMRAVPDPDLLAPRNRRRASRLAWRMLALAAVAVLGLLVWNLAPRGGPARGAGALRTLALIERRELADGSSVELNRGAHLIEHFTPTERRVRLDRGEAHFVVAHDAERPFIVEAAGVAVRAVGTAFNVRMDPASVEVLVTEGKVSVTPPAAGLVADAAARGFPLVAAGERTVVSLAPLAPMPQVSVVSPAEIEARLAWQPRLLDFTDTPLPEIVAEFNRHNPVRLVLRDSALRDLRLSATFRSDNVQGFLRLMESDFGIQTEWNGDSEIVIQRSAAHAR